jgi:ankyrin repeat protein
MKTRDQRTLEEILQSTSDVLFPAELGDRQVSLDSTDCDGDTPLHVLVWRKDRHAVDVLIAAGADVNAVGDMGETPLHVAVAQGDEAIIRSLLRAGARTDIRSEFGQTAAERAMAKGGGIARLFLDSGQD